MRAILSLFRLSGRARRTSYAIFFAVSFVGYFVMAVPFTVWSLQRDPAAVRAQMKAMETTNSRAAHMFDPILRIPHQLVVAGLVAAAVLLVVLYIVWVALSVRRLHDMNVTGWLVLVAIVVALVPYLGYLLVVLVLGLWPGTKGANRYGQDPRAPDQVADVFGRDGGVPGQPA